jgi:hypothetical protein
MQRGSHTPRSHGIPRLRVRASLSARAADWRTLSPSCTPSTVESAWSARAGRQSWALAGTHLPMPTCRSVACWLAMTEGTCTDLNTFITDTWSAPAAECSGLWFSAPLRRLQDWWEGEDRATDQQRLFSRARNMYVLGWRDQAQAQRVPGSGAKRSHSSTARLLAPTRMRTRQRTRWAAWVGGPSPTSAYPGMDDLHLYLGPGSWLCRCLRSLFADARSRPLQLSLSGPMQPASKPS